MRYALLIIAFLFGALHAMTPDDALKTLMDGNKRYMSDKLLNADNRAAKRAAVVNKQTPYAIILGCSDSRVSPEIVFDQNIGDLFVVRVASDLTRMCFGFSIWIAGAPLSSAVSNIQPCIWAPQSFSF